MALSSSAADRYSIGSGLSFYKKDDPANVLYVVK